MIPYCRIDFTASMNLLLVVYFVGFALEACTNAMSIKKLKEWLQNNRL